MSAAATPPHPHTPWALQAPRGPPSTSPGSRTLREAPPRPRPQASLRAAPNRTQGLPSSCHEAAGRGRRKGCAAEDGSLCPQHPPRAGAGGLQRAAPHGLPTGGRQRNGPPPPPWPTHHAERQLPEQALPPKSRIPGPGALPSTDRGEGQQGLGRWRGSEQTPTSPKPSPQASAQRASPLQASSPNPAHARGLQRDPRNLPPPPPPAGVPGAPAGQTRAPPAGSDILCTCARSPRANQPPTYRPTAPPRPAPPTPQAPGGTCGQLPEPHSHQGTLWTSPDSLPLLRDPRPHLHSAYQQGPSCNQGCRPALGGGGGRGMSATSPSTPTNPSS